jgi:exodeoxyribonuclease V alpha subunit
MQKFSEYMNKPDFNIMATQIIVPTKTRGDSSTYNINNTVQELYNPASSQKQEITCYINGQPYALREGDKVINVKNNYKTSPAIYNGNIGIVSEINLIEDYVIVDFLGIGEVRIDDYHSSGSLELGYAVTVHKMQGSEFENIIFGFDFSGFSLLTKELVYTGITRAKKKCDIICQTGALRMAISKNGVSSKLTHLRETLYMEAHPKIIF